MSTRFVTQKSGWMTLHALMRKVFLIVNCQHRACVVQAQPGGWYNPTAGEIGGASHRRPVAAGWTSAGSLPRRRAAGSRAAHGVDAVHNTRHRVSWSKQVHHQEASSLSPSCNIQNCTLSMTAGRRNAHISARLHIPGMATTRTANVARVSKTGI